MKMTENDSLLNDIDNWAIASEYKLVVPLLAPRRKSPQLYCPATLLTVAFRNYT